MMTKKDYIRAAQIIQATTNAVDKAAMICFCELFFTPDNPQFDAMKFRTFALKNLVPAKAQRNTNAAP